MEEQEERLTYLRKKLLTMEWDRSQKQLNPGLEAAYGELKEEFDKLQIELQNEVAVEKEIKAEEAA